MVEYKLDTQHSILFLRPKSSLEKEDFINIANSVDPYIRENGKLDGIIIDAPSFPGWDSFGAMISHFRFIKDHHKYVKKIGIVTDSVIGSLAEHLTAQFISAEVKHFSGDDMETAKLWIMEQLDVNQS